MSLHDNPSDARAYTRRQFLHSSLVLASASACVPHFIQRSAFAMPGRGAGADDERILVVLQLSGGNDGLNTVIPYRDDNYYRARPGIAVRDDDVRVLSKTGRNGTEGVGLHRALEPVQAMYDEGLCAIVQGVGYPNPNRSHFKSMDIWHTADTSGTGDGWLGRYVDAECCGYGKGESGRPDGSGRAVAPPVAIGREAPLALQGGAVSPVAFENADLFRWIGADIHRSLPEPYQQITQAGVDADAPETSNAAFLMKTALDAQISSDAIRRAVSTQPLVRYPGSSIGRQLQMVGSMIRAGLKTRVYYVTHGGFDTHAGQGGANGRHATLLAQFAGAVNAFYRDLKEQGNDQRVATMCFSEFGRRVGQNASGGTDHGTAAPMFLFGPMVRAGVHAQHPSLTDLDQGDLKYRVDFRSVYAAVLDDWMGARSRQVLDATFKPAPVFV